MRTIRARRADILTESAPTVWCEGAYIVRRMTHLLMGAAAGSLVAASASLPVAIGAVWLGVAGGGYPDWLDLRSELKASLRLRHRGASHGLPVAIVVIGVLYLALTSLATGAVGAPDWMQLSQHTALNWTMAFGLGQATHLIGDACTHAGVRPLLPLSRWRMWVLPRMLRGRSDGWLNRIALGVSFAVLGFVVIFAIARETQLL
jgi:membrane-bound metal-dependent hydrolase YbcI (DUF457 family)